jgi:hypothetical protein
MYWLRSRKRCVSWFTLIALTLQLVAAHGHTHRSEAARDAATIALSPGSIDALPQAEPSRPLDPAKQGGGPIDRFCAICAFLHQAKSLISPAQLALPEPIEIVAGQIERGCAPALAAECHRAFQARAPPAV